MSLPDSFVQLLISRLDRPNIVGIAVMGSHARRRAGKYSDVNVDLYVDVLPGNRFDRYTLYYWERRLVSVKTVLIEDEMAALSRPREAIWAVPGLRQMRILKDGTGKLAELQYAAATFEWKKLQSSADEYAVEQLMGCAEEVHKVLSGLAKENESTVLYAVQGIIQGLASSVATQRGLMIESENRYFDVIQDSIGREEEWTRAFRAALGADATPSDQPPFKNRGTAALTLYRHTTLLFQSIIPERHRRVIEHTVKLIQKAGY